MNVQWISALVLLSVTLPVPGERTVKTTSGKVRGTTVELSDGEEVEAFLGIPYAEPPVGKLRFEKPFPIAPWEGEYNATVLPPPCYQNYTQKFLGTPDVDRMTEDCLFLNIWVPVSSHDEKPKPIFVWIHGGAFVLGSASMDFFNGSMLSSRGNIIVATLNYRLGIFGFLTTPIPEAPGNMGIYDLIMAVEWINANAGAFGGDPDQITITGESAGATAASLFTISPLTRGLVKRVILESFYYPTEISTQGMMNLSEKAASITGCSSGDTNITSDPKMVVDCLKQLPPNILSEAQGFFGMTNPTLFSPHVDGILIPRDPLTMVKEGDFQEMEVLLGANLDEGSLFITLAMAEYFGIYGTMAPVLRKRQTSYFIKALFAQQNQKDPEKIAKYYVEGMGNRKSENDTDTNVDYMKTALSDSVGDALIFCPTMFQAELMSAKSPSVYFYLFTHRPSKTPTAEWMGVTHFIEVPFVFGSISVIEELCSEDDKGISGRVMDRWIAFIKTGNPNIPGEVEWPPYKWNDPYYLEIGMEDKVGRNPNYRCEFWRDRFQAERDFLVTESRKSLTSCASTIIKISLIIVIILHFSCTFLSQYYFD